jgi:hypothetical protein
MVQQTGVRELGPKIQISGANRAVEALQKLEFLCLGTRMTITRLWMEEADPTWPEDDPNGGGVGISVNRIFRQKW